ncbi:MAG: hypothetical protein M5U12_19660 [Verrucomicrobia bacterium]|nr:hypothetical protein [Verrucomicrobiota bacterium]
MHRALLVAASAIAWPVLVYFACSPPGLAQTSAAGDGAEPTNGMLPPLVDVGPGKTYKGKEGGLYPGGSNVRPAAHDAAGRKIARDIVPLDGDGKPDPVNGKVVIMPVSVSNGYGAWHRGDESDTSTTFMTRANANPAKNPKLFIAYGFEYQLPGGNGGTGDPGPDSNFYKSLDYALTEQGVTPKQVQIVWLSMPVSGKSWGTNLPPEARTFPADAQQSQLAWKEIVHAIYARYPNVKIIYSSTKGAMYMTATAAENPEFIGGPIEPFNHDAAWGVKWVIEDQIQGALDLNYDPARGPVKAPWLSWGPYFWSYPDGTPRHDDGLVWSRADVAPDGLHPSLSGLTKYANLLLHQMTTDPTATPWFLKPDAAPNKPPAVARAASVAANPVSGAAAALSVLGADDGGEPNLTYTWSSTGPAGVMFGVNGPNRARNTTATFSSAGHYTLQVTIADAGGLSATSSIAVTVLGLENDAHPAASVGSAAASLQSGKFAWRVGLPLISHPESTADTYISIKDPSVVYYEGDGTCSAR